MADVDCALCRQCNKRTLLLLLEFCKQLEQFASSSTIALRAVVVEVTRYMVQVETGDTNDFDPINDVYIVLYGERGDSGQRYLSKSKEGGLLFELFKVGRFVSCL